MGKANACLKRSYIIVTSLIAILCSLMLALTLFSHGYLQHHEEIENMIASIKILYASYIIILFFCIVGVYGACKEKQWALIVFAVGMILGSLLLLICEIHGLFARLEEQELWKKQFLDMLPLANASWSFIEDLEYIQDHMECCGLDQGYQDWGNNISLTCLCVEGSTKPCVAAPTNSILYEQLPQRPILIYKEPCLQYFINIQTKYLDTGLGVAFGSLLLWVLAVVFCIFILCQLRKKANTPSVVYSEDANRHTTEYLTDDADKMMVTTLEPRQK